MLNSHSPVDEKVHIEWTSFLIRISQTCFFKDVLQVKNKNELIPCSLYPCLFSTSFFGITSCTFQVTPNYICIPSRAIKMLVIGGFSNTWLLLCFIFDPCSSGTASTVISFFRTTHHCSMLLFQPQYTLLEQHHPTEIPFSLHGGFVCEKQKGIMYLNNILV